MANFPLKMDTDNTSDIAHRMWHALQADPANMSKAEIHKGKIKFIKNLLDQFRQSVTSKVLREATKPSNN